eukprot:gene28291-34294_t
MLLAFGPQLLDRSESPVAEANITSTAKFAVPTRAFVLLGVAMALFYAVDFSVGNWSTLYVKDELLADAGTAALSVAAYQIAALVARLTGDYWVGKFGETTVVRIGSLIGVVGMTVVVLAQSPAVAIAGFLIVGLGVPVIAPICFSAAGRMAPPDQVDAVIARINLFNYVGTVVGGGIVGAVAAFSDLRIGFLIPLAFCAILIVLAPAFAPKRATTPVAENAAETDVTITVDRAGIWDSEAIADVAAVTFPLACPPDASDDDISAFIDNVLSVDKFSEYLTDPTRTVLKVIRDGSIVGYAMLVDDEPSDPDVKAAVTLRPTTELTSLMDAVVDHARRSGSAGIWLGVNQENLRAQKFYAKHGFTQVGTKTFLVGAQLHHDFVMERPVS